MNKIKRKYRKPLEETRRIDDWKCPYCREIIRKTPDAMNNSGFDIHCGDFLEKCPECDKESWLFISPMFIARPCEND